jgi:2-phosphosulfolactate phosphatase
VNPPESPAVSTLHVHLLPQLVTPEDLAGGTVVVIDVLRATTTIACALAAGARAVIPCLEVDEARRIAATFSSGTAVLGGERGGRRIEGFDLGNSPREYTPETVGGRTVVFTTTNGTKALRHGESAKRVLLAGFVNLSAVVQALTADETIHLLCAGTRGEITGEDVLLAGAIVARLTGDESIGKKSPANLEANFSLNDQARIAVACWLRLAGDRQVVARTLLIRELRSAQGGRDLIDLGFDADIEAAAQIDRFDTVPQWDRASGAVRSS